MDTHQTAEIYNAELINISNQVDKASRLNQPDTTASAISIICGSEVTVDLKITNNKVSDFGYEIAACALTKAAVAVMKFAIIGKTQQDIQDAANMLEFMLKHDGKILDGDWSGLQLLEPVKDYTARHNSIMLPFVAVEKAFNKTLA